MSSSLRDQLIAAGLVSKSQAKQASQQQARQLKARVAPNAESKRLAEQAQAAKSARDQELARRQKDKAERKARIAQVEQMVEQARVPKIESDDYYSFVVGNKIRRVAVNALLREQITRGDLLLVRYKGHYELVPADMASRIRERDPHAVVTPNTASAKPPESVDPNDPYMDFVVPDDLMW